MAAGGMQAIGQYQGQQAQVAAANRSAASNYKYQMKVREQQWNRERLRYATQVSQYKETTAANQVAYSRAVADEQRRLNNAYKKAAFSNQNQLIQLTQQGGKMASAGAAGKSARRLDNDVVAAFGRNQAVMAENLMSAQTRFKSVGDSLGRELISANNRAFSDVAIAPEAGVAPPKPVMRQGPSPLGLIGGLTNAAIGGFNTADELTPGGIF